MKLTILFSLLVFSLNVQAWGPIGHRVVGEIAQRNLDADGAAFVRKIMGTESLAHGAVWPDEIKSDSVASSAVARRWANSSLVNGLKSESQQASIISSWHYITVPNKMTADNAPRNVKGDVLWAIEKMESVLKDKKEIDADKREALRLLAHYVGDIHQPLHAGYKDDRGGNNCWVKFFPDKKKNIVMPLPEVSENYVNLHSLWDEIMIDSLHLSFTEYAAKIDQPNVVVIAEGDRSTERALRRLTSSEIENKYMNVLASWKKSTYLDWANESVKIREMVYPKNPDGSTKGPTYCYSDRSMLLQSGDIPSVGYEYRDDMMRIADFRLAQAGLRLAHLINQIAKAIK